MSDFFVNDFGLNSNDNFQGEKKEQSMDSTYSIIQEQMVTDFEKVNKKEDNYMLVSIIEFMIIIIFFVIIVLKIKSNKKIAVEINEIKNNQDDIEEII